LRTYFRIEDGDDIRGVRAKITGTVLTLDRALEDAVPAISCVLDAVPPEDSFCSLEPAQRRRRALDGGKRLLLRETPAQPLRRVSERLPGAVGASRGGLAGFVESLPPPPPPPAVASRPGSRLVGGGRTSSRQRRMDPLPPESAGGLPGGLGGDDPSPPPLKAA